MSPKIIATVVFVFLAACGIAASVMLGGAGSMERLTTLRGIYAVCRPSGYPAVCFGEAGVQGVSCVPFTGECK